MCERISVVVSAFLRLFLKKMSQDLSKSLQYILQKKFQAISKNPIRSSKKFQAISKIPCSVNVKHKIFQV